MSVLLFGELNSYLYFDKRVELQRLIRFSISNAESGLNWLQQNFPILK